MRTSKVYIAGFLLLVVYSVIYLQTDPSFISLQDAKVLGWFALLQFLYAIYSWHKLAKIWFDGYIIFSFALYAFTLSQPILEALDCWVSHRRLWGEFGVSNAIYYEATYYSMVATMFFHFGAIAQYRGVKLIATPQDYSLKTLQTGATVIALISAPFFLFILAQQFIVVQSFGYIALYNWEEYTSRSTQILSDAFVPSIIVLFCISMIKKQHVKLMSLIAFFLVFLPPFFLGGRSNAMIIFAVFFIVYLSVNKVKTRYFVVLALSGGVMLMAMNIVGKIRMGTDRSLEAIETATKSSDESAILSTIEEMGWSMYPTALTMKIVPDKIDYSYGSSFFWAGVSVIPNLGFWDGVHPGKLNDPGYKLNKYANLGYGIGYSIVAGSYNEFGPFGFILMFLYGLVFARIFSFISPSKTYARPIQYIMAILFLWFAIKFVRNSYDSFVRNAVYYVLPFYLMTKFKMK